MAVLFGAGQERPRRFVRFGRVTAFIGAVVLLLAVGACDPGDRGPELERVSFKSWSLRIDPPEIIFYDIGTLLRGNIYDDRAVFVKNISVKTLSSLQPGTAVLDASGSWCNSGQCYFKKATLFVSSQAEADAWNRYFAELLTNHEKEMREKWAPQKIKPPPTFKEDILNTCSDPC